MIKLLVGLVLGFAIGTFGVDHTVDLMKDGLDKTRDAIHTATEKVDK